MEIVGGLVELRFFRQARFPYPLAVCCSAHVFLIDVLIRCVSVVVLVWDASTDNQRRTDYYPYESRLPAKQIKDDGNVPANYTIHSVGWTTEIIGVPIPLYGQACVLNRKE